MPALTALNDALAVILESLGEIGGSESLPLDSCLARILAEDLVSEMNVPPADNSAVDGYVVTADLCQPDSSRGQIVSARIPAGTDPAPLEQTSVARIFTGANVPLGGAAVVMQEDCALNGDQVILPGDIQAGQNIRPAGQDIAAGTRILKRGTCLGPAELGLAASVGVAALKVKKPLKVAIFSTGDELVEPGKSAPAGKIYNSNRYTLAALLKRLSVDVLDCGIVADTLQATTAILENSARQADLIISSGGVSVGEEDHIKAAVQQLGQLKMWKLAIKPGKPLAYGLIGNTPFLGLPGNPSSVFVTFCLVATKVIAKLQGRSLRRAYPVRLPAFFDVTTTSQREEYRRVRLSQRAGLLGVESYPNQSSGVLVSASWADGFAVIPKNREVKTGDLVDFLAFASFGV